jgi:plasmid stabilization system protein ParE
MNRPVIVMPQAEAHIRRIDAWWRVNRTASPELFQQELADALSTLELVPEAGTRYSHSKVRGVRRIHLRATRHHIYYVVGKEAVAVLAVWGAIKGAGPDLKEHE